MSGVKVREPMLAKAFEMRETSEAGISLTLDDLPNIVVYDLMKIIENEQTRLVKKKRKTAEHNSGRMTNQF